MGLEITAYYDVKVHECDSKKEIGTVTFWRWNEYQSDVTHDIKNAITPSEWTKFETPEYECNCEDEDKIIKQLSRGYTSQVPATSPFQPGQLIECGKSEYAGFCYGSYFKWYNDGRNFKDGYLFSKMSDCDGYYTGGYLVELCKLFEENKNQLTDKQQEYYEMLKEIPEEKLKTCTIVQHH